MTARRAVDRNALKRKQDCDCMVLVLHTIWKPLCNGPAAPGTQQDTCYTTTEQSIKTPWSRQYFPFPLKLYPEHFIFSETDWFSFVSENTIHLKDVTNINSAGF